MLGHKLREARLAIGLNQGQFATLLGIDRNTVNRIERGRGAPRIATLAAWAQACGLSLDELVTCATAESAPGAVKSAGAST